jgi:hypothetical protein
MSDGQIGFQGPADQELEAGGLSGLYLGLVMDNQDPLKLGRVKIHVVGQTRKETDWAFPVGMPGGGGIPGQPAKGGFFVPRLQATVLTGFLNGDIQNPYYWAGHYLQGAGGAPLVPRIVAEQSIEQAPNVRVIAETETFEIYITDTPTSKKVMIETLDGENIIELDAIDGSIRLRARHHLILEAPEGNVKISGMNVYLNEKVAMVGGLTA